MQLDPLTGDLIFTVALSVAICAGGLASLLVLPWRAADVEAASGARGRIGKFLFDGRRWERADAQRVGESCRRA